MIPKFDTRKELFSYLKANKSEVVEMKKAAMKKADSFGMTKTSSSSNSAVKMDSEESGSIDVINRDIVGNTYLWLDTHGDVHAKGCFKKSISERAKKVFFLHDHEFKTTSRVGTFKAISEVDIPWRDLGVDKNGITQALIANADIERKRNKQVFEDYKNEEIDQHSVGMYYVKIDLAMNSEEEEDKEEKALYDEYVVQLGNREDAEEKGFFWVVKEAKLSEISCVLAASNVVTPTMKPYHEDEEDEEDKTVIEVAEAKTDVVEVEVVEDNAEQVEPSQDTQCKAKEEPSQDTQKLFTNYFKENFKLD
jgi:hypothetical protein